MALAPTMRVSPIAVTGRRISLRLLQHEGDHPVVIQGVAVDAHLAERGTLPREDVRRRAVAYQGAQLRFREGVLEEIAFLDLKADLQERRSRLAAGASPLPPVDPRELRCHERLADENAAGVPSPGRQPGELAGPSAAVHDGHGGLQMRAARGQHRQVARPLDGPRELPLVLGADARLPPRLDLGLIGDIPDEHVHVLVVDVGDVVGAKAAHLAPGVVAAPAAPARPAAGARTWWAAGARTWWAAGARSRWAAGA